MESSYYMAPDEAGEKPYALLFEALRQTGFCALAKIAMHNREHIVILRPASKGILLHTMYYKMRSAMVDEFRTDTSLIKKPELELAKSLISSLAADFDPEKYHDEYRDNLKGLIQAKVEGRETVEPPAATHLAPVVDIMEALKMSLANAKKPAQSVKSGSSESAATEKSKRTRKGAGGA